MRTLLFTLMITLIVQATLAADTVHLNNGDIVSGTITTLNDNKVTMKTEYGTVMVKKDFIKRIEFSKGNGDPGVFENQSGLDDEYDYEYKNEQAYENGRSYDDETDFDDIRDEAYDHRDSLSFRGKQEISLAEMFYSTRKKYYRASGSLGAGIGISSLGLMFLSGAVADSLLISSMVGFGFSTLGLAFGVTGLIFLCIGLPLWIAGGSVRRQVRPEYKRLQRQHYGEIYSNGLHDRNTMSAMIEQELASFPLGI
jgi:hypothetical protein